ncbi:uncharacterized protein LOC114713368 isoform X1 [Neltuma alba]|uniref:uncharacterized protein LOC114713368 isoform X1 n=1 Tax=Neltuma alba TaxID=207710 RepID=UPI0010A31B22|nr:uncharacterized protein LOC114713368 isoform X1 [Prosopis alba]
MNPRSLLTLAMGTGVILGGIFTLNLASTVTLKTLHLVSERKRKKVALPCMACRGKGFYICKLCKGNSTIEWSPLYDPIAINPCLCPTCEGNRVCQIGHVLFCRHCTLLMQWNFCCDMLNLFGPLDLLFSFHPPPANSLLILL